MSKGILFSNVKIGELNYHDRVVLCNKIEFYCKWIEYIYGSIYSPTTSYERLTHADVKYINIEATSLSLSFQPSEDANV